MPLSRRDRSSRLVQHPLTAQMGLIKGLQIFVVGRSPQPLVQKVDEQPHRLEGLTQIVAGGGQKPGLHLVGAVGLIARQPQIGGAPFDLALQIGQNRGKLIGKLALLHLQVKHGGTPAVQLPGRRPQAAGEQQGQGRHAEPDGASLQSETDRQRQHAGQQEGGHDGKQRRQGDDRSRRHPAQDERHEQAVERRIGQQQDKPDPPETAGNSRCDRQAQNPAFGIVAVAPLVLRAP